MNLIDDLIKQKWLKTPRIIEAFRKIKRKDFLVVKTENKETLAELNQAMSIGYEQTISQPLTVAFMLELLQPVYGDKILDIGSGSGWTSALLAYIVSKEGQNTKSGGKIIAIELVPELKKIGKKNVAKYDYIKNGIVEFICSDGSKGCPNIKTRKEFAEGFDKILCSAEAKELPQAWKEQLKINGRIVVPIGHSVWLFIKKSETEYDQKEFPGFVFVPLVSE